MRKIRTFTRQVGVNESALPDFDPVPVTSNLTIVCLYLFLFFVFLIFSINTISDIACVNLTVTRKLLRF